jgi:phosphocarrier protein HPr
MLYFLEFFSFVNSFRNSLLTYVTTKRDKDMAKKRVDESICPCKDDPSKFAGRFQIRNAWGLHARPSAYLIRLINETKSVVNFTYKRRTVRANCIINLVTLGAPYKSYVTVTAKGPDAEEVLVKLRAVFENKFDGVDE